MALTVKQIEAIKKSDKRQEIADGNGLYLVVQPSGTKGWVHRYRFGGKPVKLKIGDYPAMSLAKARNALQANQATLSGGTGDDPRYEKQALKAAVMSTAFADYADAWLKRYAEETIRRNSQNVSRKATGVAQARAVVENHLKPVLKSRPIAKINAVDITAILDGTSVKSRRGIFAYTRVLFKDAVKRGVIKVNPLANMDWPAPADSRDHKLEDDELAATWKAAGDMALPWASFFRLLILTGQRRNEVSGLKWDEVNRSDALWTLPASRSKNRFAHVVPLSYAVIDILDNIAGGEEWPSDGFVLTTTGRTAISGFSKKKAALDSIAGVTGWRIHDLRRTLIAGLQKLGTPFEVREAILNHRTFRTGLAGAYHVHDYADEKRDALTAWSRFISITIDDKLHKAYCALDKTERQRFKEAIHSDDETWTAYVEGLA